MGQEVEAMVCENKENGSHEPNDGAEKICDRPLLSLLASKDRDFLLSPTGNQVKISDLEGKITGLYFSANWNQPCQKFTQVLIGFYKHIKDTGLPFEIVFLSCDEDSEAFNQYYACMPWLAIPFRDLETKRALNDKFEIEDIPCLIILQPNCTKYDAAFRDGVDIIYRHGVRAFPFTSERLEELHEEEKARHENQTVLNLLAHDNRNFLLGHPLPNQVEVASLVGKTLGLYFSAQWCIPGAKFTPKLIAVYQNINQKLVEEERQQEDFEIIFVSNDCDENAFNAYYSTMPWLALPFGDQTVKELAKHFDVQRIPCLVILGPDGKTLTKHGRNLINLYQENAYPFTGAKLELLEKQMDEEAKKLPRSGYHEGHRHELNLVSQGNGGGPFICCDCDEQGSGWAYQCLECGYEVHPKCMRAVDRGGSVVQDN